MEVQDTLITPCYASVQTVRIVLMCPADMSSYKEAVNKKNCLALAAYGQDCQNLQYHCVLSEDLKYAIEVCAPSSYIVGMLSILVIYFLCIHLWCILITMLINQF